MNKKSERYEFSRGNRPMVNRAGTRNAAISGWFPRYVVLTLLLVVIPTAIAQSALKRDLFEFSKDKAIRGDGTPTTYAVGTVNGGKLRIPTYYLHYGVVYEGDRRDGLGAASTTATQDSRIDNFGILLRMSTLEPIRTEQDRKDWQDASMQTDFEKTWLMVTFDNHYPPPAKAKDHQESMLETCGPYIPGKAMHYGLVHYESVQTIEDGSRSACGHVEYFFDDKSMTTITCQTHKIKVAPFSTFDTCHNYFLVPEFHLLAEAFFTKKDLPRWAEIEERVRAIARSFVVQKSAARGE